jgi:DNA-directed RNA polymerase specialized sigma24 family protein
MLGSASEAEDVVQDTWLRARQDEHANGRIRAIYVVRNPDKLREFLEHV